MKKAIIFDMDGVLIDSQPLHFEVDIRVLQQFGYPATLQDVEKYAGMSNPDRWAKYKRDYDLQATENELIEAHIIALKNLFDSKEGLKPIKGIVQLLQMLKEKDLQMSVASSSSYDFVHMVLDKLKISEYFDIIVSGEDMEKSKPAPDIFLATARKHNVSVEDCVVIEDSHNGVSAAKAANIFCIGYINKTSGEQNISKADIIINDFHKLVQDSNWLY